MKFDVKILAALAVVAATPALAEGDAAAGEKVFNQCATCHSIVDDAGTQLAGRGAKTGPNLYGVLHRAAGSRADFEGYGEDMKAAGAKGLTWDEEHFLQYVQNPSKFLQGYLENKKAKGKMTFQLKKEEDAKNVWAYVTSLGPK